MVKKQNKGITNNLTSKGLKERALRARKINASTEFETCTEKITPFGGLLGSIKFLDLVQLEEIFDDLYIAPVSGHRAYLHPIQGFRGGKGTGCSWSGVIFSLKRNSGREKIRSERSRNRRSERSERNMPSLCLSGEKVP